MNMSLTEVTRCSLSCIGLESTSNQSSQLYVPAGIRMVKGTKVPGLEPAGI